MYVYRFRSYGSEKKMAHSLEPPFQMFRLDIFDLFDQAAGRATFANLINRKYKNLIQAQCTLMILVLEQILAGNRCVTFFGASVGVC